VYATTSCSGPYFYVWPVRLHILEPDRVLVLIAAVEEWLPPTHPMQTVTGRLHVRDGWRELLYGGLEPALTSSPWSNCRSFSWIFLYFTSYTFCFLVTLASPLIFLTWSLMTCWTDITRTLTSESECDSETIGLDLDVINNVMLQCYQWRWS